MLSRNKRGRHNETGLLRTSPLGTLLGGEMMLNRYGMIYQTIMRMLN